MAIHFSSLPPSADPLPERPSLLRWAAVFLACTMLGVVLMLLAWPKHVPTATPLFWITIIGVPLVAASVLVVARFFFDAALQRQAESWNAMRDAHVAELYREESRPIMLLAGAQRFSMVDKENIASTIASGELRLKPQPTPDKAVTIEARWFEAPPYAMDSTPADYDAQRQRIVLDDLLAKLLDSVSKQLGMLPVHLGLAVKLHVAAPALGKSVDERFHLAWRQKGLREVSIVNQPQAPNLMSLDAWLDTPAGEARDHATLLVVIALRNLVSQQPPEGSAEAGVALLMVPQDIAQHHHLEAVAQIHRPRQGSVASLPDTLKFALRWGAADAGTIHHLWHSGFDTVSRQALLAAAGASGITLTAEQRVSGEHDLDRTVGDGGNAADWLALACACDFAQSFGGPQLLARHDGRELLLSVVRAMHRTSSHTSL